MAVVHAGGRVRVGDVELAWSEHGAGPPMVMVHGYTGGQHDWHAVVGPLAERRRVITYDHRGHGQSTHLGDEAAYSFENLELDLLGLADGLGLERFDLVGHSMGGIVSLRFVLDHPERVASLVMVDSAAAPSPDDGSGRRAIMRAGIELARHGGMEAVFDAASPFLGVGPAADEQRTRLHDSFSAIDPAAFIAFGTELMGYPSMIDRLGEVGVPTTVIVGADDVALRSAADDLAAGIPGAQLVVIDGAGHLPHEEQPAAWLAAMDGHLARSR